MSKFDAIYDSNEGELKKAKKPFVKAKCERKLSAGKDDAALTLIELKEEKERLLCQVDNLNVNALINLEEKIEKAEKVEGLIQKISDDLFK